MQILMTNLHGAQTASMNLLIRKKTTIPNKIHEGVEFVREHDSEKLKLK